MQKSINNFLPGQRLVDLLKNLLAFLFGCIITFFVAEVLLRTFDPIKLRIRGQHIILPVNQKYIFSNPSGQEFGKIIYHTKNTLGFRGPEKPENWNSSKTIFTVGGSTTECFLLSDGKDWPTLLGEKLKRLDSKIWLNNAGLDGHTTFGHTILVKDYLSKLHPNYIIYLTGANDIEKDSLSVCDKIDLVGYESSFKKWCFNHSEVLNTLQSIRMSILAKDKKLTHSFINFKELKFVNPDPLILKRELEKQAPYLNGYKKRLENLVQLSELNGIVPVLVTQPSLVGCGNDDLTGIDLASVQLGNTNGGCTYWKILELYNDVTRRVAKEKNIKLVDLARLLPKSTRYFYDFVHYNNKGGEKVSEILYDQLKDFIK